MENNLIHLTIDGVAVEAVPGSTILQAASAAGINIPTLCYLKHLTPDASCRMCVVEDERGNTLEVNASSLGGGRVRVNAIDGLDASFTGDYPTLIIRNEDRPGAVAEVTSILSRRKVNIATMQLYRNMRGGLAVMVMESDQDIWQEAVEELRSCPGIVRVTYLNMQEGN